MVRSVSHEELNLLIVHRGIDRMCFRAILLSPVMADLRLGYRRYPPLTEKKLAKAFRQGDQMVLVTWHQQPVVSRCLRGFFRTGRVPL
jgi:hypothetical protein